jgi:hypothetical protein
MIATLAGSMFAFTHGALAAQAGRIDKITPAAARLGERVIIRDNGFGARNVRITVGGISARVVSANGNQVTFLVPDGVAPGATRVTATNPGGKTGSIGFQVLGERLPEIVAQEDAQASSSVVSPVGRTVTATATVGIIYSLTIPVGALDADTTITVTPVTAIANLPFSGPLLAAVRLEPSGLKLVRPATLTITLPGPIDPTGLLGFLFNDDGTNFEVVRTAINGTTLTLAVEHFTTGGVAQADLQDFARQIEPLLNALPNTLPPTQVASLISSMMSWIDRFGFAVCEQTTLCQRVFQISLQSLTLHRTEACNQSMNLVNDGEPFLAREALRPVLDIAAKLLELGRTAAEVGVPGFDTQLDLACIGTTLQAIADVAQTQALANPRPGLLVLFVDIGADAGLLGLEDVQQHALTALQQVLDTLLDQVNQTCLADPDAGEILVDLVLTTFTNSFLDGLEPDLATRFRDARAGCRIRISPQLPTVELEQQVQFTATTEGLSPSSVTWSIQSPALGSTIDPQSGLFTAGQFEGTVVVVATSVADQSRFKRAPVTLVQGSCPAPTTGFSSFSRSRARTLQTTAVTCIQVAVSSPTTTVNVGGTVQFTATVTGSQNTAVTWAVDGVNGGNSTVGTISGSGLYTAPAAAGTHTVRATSVAAPSVFAEAGVTIIISNGTITDILHPTFIGACASADVQVFTSGFINPGMTFTVQGDGSLRNQTLIGTTTFTTWKASSSATGEIVVTAISVENPNVTADAFMRVDPFVAAYGNPTGSRAFASRGADAGLPDDTYRVAVHIAASPNVDRIFAATLGANGLSGTNPNGDSISVVIDASAMQGTLQAGGSTIQINLTHNCAP